MAGTFLTDGSFGLLMTLLGQDSKGRVGPCCGRITNEREFLRHMLCPKIALDGECKGSIALTRCLSQMLAPSQVRKTVLAIYTSRPVFHHCKHTDTH